MIRLRLSPNHGPRRGGVLPDMVVIHYTAMASVALARDRLCDPGAAVSAHYLIAADGAVDALVPEPARAWHAGAGAWGAVGDVNSHSIGIELDNDGRSGFAQGQMAALVPLLARIMARWSIAPRRVIGHACMAPDRKDDPGPLFDWAQLARHGLAVAAATDAPPLEPDWERFRQDAAAVGYPPCAPERLLAVFRDRHRPGAAGPLDPRDMGLMADLAHRFPVDRAGARP